MTEEETLGGRNVRAEDRAQERVLEECKGEENEYWKNVRAKGVRTR